MEFIWTFWLEFGDKEEFGIDLGLCKLWPIKSFNGVLFWFPLLLKPLECGVKLSKFMSTDWPSLSQIELLLDGFLKFSFSLFEAGWLFEEVKFWFQFWFEEMFGIVNEFCIGVGAVLVENSDKRSWPVEGCCWSEETEKKLSILFWGFSDTGELTGFKSNRSIVLVGIVGSDFWIIGVTNSPKSPKSSSSLMLFSTFWASLSPKSNRSIVFVGNCTFELDLFSSVFFIAKFLFNFIGSSFNEALPLLNSNF